MAGPEATSPPDGSEFKAAPSMLEDSREEIANERAHESTTMRSQGDLSEPSYAERTYIGAETQRILDSLDKDLADAQEKKDAGTPEDYNKLSSAELIHRAAVRSMEGRIALAQADADALEARQTAQGKGKIARFMQKYRNSTKLRLGIAAASGVAAVGLAATGLWMPALGVKLASGALRGGAAYLGAREGMQWAQGKRENRKGPDEGAVAEGEKRVPRMNEADMRKEATRLAGEKPGTVIAMIARMESPHIAGRRSPEQKEQADKWLSALRKAELQRTEETFTKAMNRARIAAGKKLDEGKPENVSGEIKNVMAAELQNAMKARREQIKTDKKSHRLQKGAAILLAGGAFASGAVGWLTNAAEHAQGAGSATGGAAEGVAGGGATEDQFELHRQADDQFGAAGEIYTQSEYIVDPVNPGEGPKEAALKHILNTQEGAGLDPGAQDKAAQELADRMARTADGQSWRIEKADMADIIKNHQ